jgi:hypothetical protein
MFQTTREDLGAGHRQKQYVVRNRGHLLLELAANPQTVRVLFHDFCSPQWTPDQADFQRAADADSQHLQRVFSTSIRERHQPAVV